MKIIKAIRILMVVISFVLVSCELDGGESLNGASTSSISDDISRGELTQAVSGVLSDMRVGLSTHNDVKSIFGREYYYFTSSDPRYEGDVVVGNLDNNTFYVTTPWGARYATVKNINLILEGLDNTTADFSAAEIAGARGVLNTLKAYELLMLSDNQHDNGIRVDVSDSENLGAFLDRSAALSSIAGLLDSAAGELGSAGDSFAFGLSSGYSGFDTPQTFLQFNRALMARVSAYQGDYTTTLAALNASFFDLAGDLDGGIYHTFSLSGQDIANPLFIALNQTANVRVAHSSFVTDVQDGDTRLEKVVERDEPREATGLVGTHDVALYGSNVDNIPVLRNEELILLYAEANMQTNPGEAVAALDVLRTAAGLPAYTGTTTPAALEDEILYNRRYSLFGEGHRWIDMRRFGRLSDLPNDRSTDNVPSAIPVPANENK
ncbi:RagB/SusD family nutrient uptake outer membrane protein [Cytophaga sp. FL35]|uniref:RagB/SusD family nutrient uptake outer membrane protein n=1 Tax=Cytophaga sp. FL35 TaxID=1904456 RepID=UPI001653EA69|nr:RagB/SusD family nutrient uptake outer membrane protein [Cytophaga sp. FL35]MBC6997362.1 RagB/SusD family nutrient uptake outer membrane protein [Cytophaga sp. FL35]